MNSNEFNDPFQLTRQIAGWIAATTAFVTAVAGFIQAVQGNLSLYTTLLLICSIGLLWLICLYYARFWKPQIQDKGIEEPSLFLLRDETIARQREQAQFKREKKRKQVQRSAKAGLLLIPLLALAGFGGWQYLQNQPSTDTIVLIADFQNQQTAKDDYAVTKTIWERLENAVDDYPEVKLIRSKTSFEDSEAARSAGKAKKAAIVLWGWYSKTEQAVPISVSFELLRPFQLEKSEAIPELDDISKGQVQTVASSELERFTLQTQLSGEMSYLTLFVLGMTRYAAKDWDQAIEHFSIALKQVEGEVKVLKQSIIYNFRGKSYYHTEEFEQAIADFTKAIELDPKFVLAYHNRGYIYSKQGNYEQAIADYNKAIELDPKFVLAYHNRGYIYSEQGNYEQAIADYNKAIELDPKFVLAYTNRGNANYDQGNHKQAIDDYNKAIELDPKFTFAYNDRGKAYANQGKYQQAIDDYTKAIALDPKYVDAYNNRGAAYANQGKYEKAIDDYTKAIALKLDSKPADSYFWRGQIYQQQGKKTEAVQDFKQFLILTEGTTSADYMDQRKHAKEQLKVLGAIQQPVRNVKGGAKR